ncbi:hypothetical protein DL768_010481 [Monosporascus sp. mg162]|nr:hypothetical protein DL768_010481 [Monosporascus sp. mg162]
MSSKKPLPLVPKDRRRVKFVTPSPTASTTSSTTHASASSSKTYQEHSPQTSLNPYAHYLRRVVGEQDLSDDEGPYSEDDHVPSEAQLVPRKLATQKSERQSTLERRITKLEQEKYVLQQQVKKLTARDNREKKGIVTQLQKQNKQYEHNIRQQNQLVARIANTINHAFQEYQEAVGKSSQLSDEESCYSVDSDGKSEIKVYSQFDDDSESDY